MSLARTARARASSASDPFVGIIGDSDALGQAIRLARAVAQTDATVLILGETGTGKELLARAIHAGGARRAGPFVDVNCAALPAGLLESELFGHEKGAFTGAIARQAGRFEQASGGTLFLDEVGELPIQAQAKLLRALQERTVEHVGGARPIDIDVRVVAATNHDLTAATRKGLFREDLFFRLSAFPIRVPPLRERVEDIPRLARHFMREHARRLGKPAFRLTPSGVARLVRHSWPGNVRELENYIERAVILSQGTSLILDEIPVAEAGTAAAPAPERGTEPRAHEPVLTLAEAERRAIVTALEASGGRVSGRGGAAELLDVKPSTLYSRMKKRGIKR